MRVVPFIYRADCISLEPSITEEDSPELFDVRIAHEFLGSNCHRSVHVPTSIRSAFSDTGDRWVHLVAIDTNSLSSFALPGRPQFIATGVKFLDGRRVEGLPLRIRRSRRIDLATCAALALVGLVASMNSEAVCAFMLAMAAGFGSLTFSALPDLAPGIRLP
jgi:hypothetical protein